MEILKKDIVLIPPAHNSPPKKKKKTWSLPAGNFQYPRERYTLKQIKSIQYTK